MENDLGQKAWYRVLQVLFVLLSGAVLGVVILILISGHYVGMYPSGQMEGYDVITWGLWLAGTIVLLGIVRSVVLYILTGKFDK